MKKWSTVLFGALVCASAAASAKEPQFVDYSQKSSADLAGCIALKLSEYRNYQVQKKETGQSIEMRMKFRIVGIGATAATFLIDDLGDRRRLTVFATGKETGLPRTIAGQTRECVSS